MHLVHMLWKALVLAYTGTTAIISSGVLLGAGLLFLVCVVGLALFGGVLTVFASPSCPSSLPTTAS